MRKWLRYKAWLMWIKKQLRLLRSSERRRQFVLFATIAVIVLADSSTFLQNLFWSPHYDLGDAKPLVASTSTELLSKFSFDEKNNSWQFNQQAKPALGQMAESDAIKVGEVSYSASLPKDLNGSKGLSLKNTQTDQTITFSPEFSLASGERKDERFIYPISGSDSQLVYTFKKDGVKEDIVLHKAPGDSAEFAYELKLPAGLEARLQNDGSVGIFGGDPSLFGNISYGSDKDRTLVDKARQSSAKDHLYYVIPAPVIRGNNTESVKAHFVLDGKQLAVEVSGLKNATYPLSIDPSFVMDTTSCSWQSNGNNEDNVSFSSCQISRSGLSGGDLGSWQYNNGSSTSLSAAPSGTDYSVTVINGYMYLSGRNGGAGVYYASINPSTGVVGSFVATTASPSPTYDVRDSRAVTVNGYLYLIGGINASTTVIKAKPTSGGDITSWTAVSSLNTGRLNFGVAAYNGRIYVMGGCSAQSSWPACTTITDTTEYASVRADGSLTSWTISTSLATGSLAFANQLQGTFANNGYLYAIGGTDAAFSLVRTPIYYAPINSDGSIGQWVSLGLLSTARYAMGVAVSNNYVYLIGGRLSGGSSNTTQLAKIYANGTLGPFQSSSNFTSNRTLTGAVAYNGKVYLAGGCSSTPNACGSTYQDLQYASINTTLGNTSSYTGTSTYNSAGIMSYASVAANGYIYLIGGTTITNGGDSGQLATTRYAAINSDGSLGTWNTTSSSYNNTNSTGAGCSAGCNGRLNAAAGAYNGYIYLAGGVSNGTGVDWSDVQSAVICTGVNTPVTGCAGAGDLRGTAGGGSSNWDTKLADFVTNSTSTYSQSDARSQLSMQIYNGYMYLVGGHEGTTNHAQIYYAPLTTSGGVGTFNSTTSLPSARSGSKTFVSGGRFYVVGGGLGTSWSTVSSDNDDVIFTTIDSSTGALSSTCPSGYTCLSGTSWVDANASANGGSGNSFVAAGTGLSDYGVAVSNGYLYISGGQNGNGASATYNTVYKAKLNNNGSMGSWSTITGMGKNRYSHAYIAANGFLYSIGGCDNKNALGGINCNSTTDMFSDYQTAQIYNGGGGRPGSSATTTALPTAAAAVMSVCVNGYIYSAGGATDTLTPTALTDVNYAKVNNDGTLGSWTSGPSLNTARYDGAITTSGGYIYVMGGRGSGGAGSLNTGEYAKVNGDGTLGSWTQFSMSDARMSATGFVSNGYLYIAGGTTNFTTGLNTVKYSKLGSNGAPGSWSTATAGFTTARYRLRGFSGGNGSVYIMGGFDGTNYLSDVQYATPTGSGDITSWSYGPSFPFARMRFSSVVANGYVYIYSGVDASGARTDIYYAPIMANGSLGTWSYGGAISGTAEYWSGSATSGGYLYLVGGSPNGLNVASTVSYVPLQGTSNAARYSLYLKTDMRTLPVNYFSNVIPQNSSSSISTALSLATAGSAFSFSAGDTGIQSMTKYPLAIANSDGGTAYSLLITLDDTASAYFGESSTAGSNVSYFKLNYHPNPAMRLRGGKTFNGNSLQSLDAP